TPLLPRGGPELCFLLNGVSFLAVLAALAAMRGTAPQAAAPEADSWQALRDGARYVLGHPLLSLLLVLTTAVAMFGWPILTLLPALAARQLHGGPQGYSSLLSALAIGALTAAFLVASFGSFARRWVFIGSGVGLASCS